MTKKSSTNQKGGKGGKFDKKKKKGFLENKI